MTRARAHGARHQDDGRRDVTAHRGEEIPAREDALHEGETTVQDVVSVPDGVMTAMIDGVTTVMIDDVIAAPDALTPAQDTGGEVRTVDVQPAVVTTVARVVAAAAVAQRVIRRVRVHQAVIATPRPEARALCIARGEDDFVNDSPYPLR